MAGLSYLKNPMNHYECITPARMCAAASLASEVCASLSDVLGYLASGMSEAEILEDFPYLELGDLRASIAFAADFECKLMTAPSL